MLTKQKKMFVCGSAILLVLLCVFVTIVSIKESFKAKIIKGVRDAGAISVVWHGWHPGDMEENGFLIEGTLASDLSTYLSSHIDTDFLPSTAMARPTITIYCHGSSGKIEDKFIVRMALDEKAEDSIDPLLKLAASGERLSAAEIEKLERDAPSIPPNNFLNVELVLRKSR